MNKRSQGPFQNETLSSDARIRRSLAHVVLIAAIASVFLPFQNCGQGFEAMSVDGLTNSQSLTGGNLKAFNADFYIKEYDDVASAVQQKQVQDAYEHYRLIGAAEGRLADFPLEQYLACNPDVQMKLSSGQIQDPKAYYFQFGQVAGQSLLCLTTALTADLSAAQRDFQIEFQKNRFNRAVAEARRQAADAVAEAQKRVADAVAEAQKRAAELAEAQRRAAEAADAQKRATDAVEAQKRAAELAEAQRREADITEQIRISHLNIDQASNEFAAVTAELNSQGGALKDATLDTQIRYYRVGMRLAVLRAESFPAGSTEWLSVWGEYDRMKSLLSIAQQQRGY